MAVKFLQPNKMFMSICRLSFLCRSKRLRDVIHGDLLPSAEMITALSHQYGVPLTDEDLFIQKPPLLSVSSDDYTVPGKVSRVKQAVYSSLDNYNEMCVQRKKEIADKKSFERNHIGVSSLRYARGKPNSCKTSYPYSTPSSPETMTH